MLFSCSLEQRNDSMFSITEEEFRTVKLCYYSDYFSFIGRDEQGRVAFALDNNRGRDGDRYQAEHFAVLHDEKTGWQDVPGSGPYENVSKQLVTIPDSPYFSFRGNSEKGLMITGGKDGLIFTIEPIHMHVASKMGLAEYRLGSAAATLIWHGRALKGRVIYEYLFVPAYNRLTRRYAGGFDDFHGIYASVGNDGDLYIHRQRSEYFHPLIEKEDGFLFLNGEGRRMTAILTRVPSRSFAWGFYRWPASWEGSFEAGKKRYEFELDLSERKTVLNWVIGGFSMGIVTGKLIAAGETRQLYGLGELIL